MFTALFGALLEFTLFVVAIVIVYQIFLGDWVANMRANRKALKDRSKNADKLARIKLTSTDIREIENFVEQNAQFVSEDMINQIASHLEELHAQETITQYDAQLKDQIEIDTETMSIQDRPQRRHNTV